jgi:hypothetical protein
MAWPSLPAHSAFLLWGAVVFVLWTGRWMSSGTSAHPTRAAMHAALTWALWCVAAAGFVLLVRYDAAAGFRAARRAVGLE